MNRFKSIFVLVILMVSMLLVVTACGGSNNSSNSGSSNQQSTGSSEGTAPSTTPATNQAPSTTQANGSIVGDWEYTGTINGKVYDITLDLGDDNRFELDVDDESTEGTVDSEAEGTYVSDASTITLSIATVQDPNSAFSGTVVQNGQSTLNYTLNGNTLTLTNAKDSIAILPGSIDMIRD